MNLTQLKNELKKIIPKYNKVECPICKSRFNHFATVGTIPRKNALCWTCASRERHRLVWLYLNQKTDFFDPAKHVKLLHVAPEKVLYDKLSKTKKITYFPCDLSPELYDYNGSVKIFPVDITSILFEENFFDVIFCNHVLEHIPDDLKAMKELFRVMKRGGWGIFQVPIQNELNKTYEDFSIISPDGRLKAFGQEDHVRLYGKDYNDRLQKAGFDVLEDDYVKTFSKKDQFKYGLMKEEKIYFCRKK